VIIYEQLLNQDRRWAMDEGDRHFQKDDAVFKSLRKIARKLEELGVDYAIAGGMALDAHGFRRLTVDVDILVTLEGLKTIHEGLDGLGYVPLFSKSKNLRDAEHGVRIEFLIAGEYPGDGKPKPVAFPDPAEAGVEIDGIRYLSLPKLVELKIASGMTNPGRLKDLGDVQELIRLLHLPAEFADSLDPFVRARYRELWEGVRQGSEEP
jgi:hypothetical protein